MNNIPRRIRVDLLSPAELAIKEAQLAVENMPADVLLTQATILLQQARDKVADYVDQHACSICGKVEPPTPPGPPRIPGPWYCLNHRHLQPRTQFA